MIRRCCAIKAQVVSDDEKETAASGGRALLNLGHTFAHAIENVAGYGQYLHGEAVSIGLCLATRLSVALGQIDEREIAQVESMVTRFHLPLRLHEPLNTGALLAAMQKDKKNRGGQLRFVSMTDIGTAVTSEDVNPELIEQLWHQAGAN
jgi:3-dehydroquinate synthase